MVEKLVLFKKSTLVGFLGVLLLAGFMITSMASYYLSKSNIRHSVLTRELPLASDNINAEIQRILLPPLNVSATMANSVFVRDWLLDGEQNVDKITEYLNKIKTKQEMTSAFLVSAKTKNYYSYSGKTTHIEKSDDWYHTFCKIAPEFEINADIDNHVSNELTIFINYKVYDYENNFIGVTGVATKIDSIEQLIQRFKVRYKKDIYFVSPTGEIAFRTNNGNVDLNKNSLSTYMGSQELADQIISQKACTLEYERDHKTIWLNARFLPELQWYLVVEDPEKNNLEPLKKLLALNLAICVVITLCVLLVVFMTIQQYQKRLLSQNQQLKTNNHCIQEQAAELAEQNQQLKKLTQEKDEFLSITVHDLKTPLNGVIGFADLGLSESPDQATTEHFNCIKDAGLSMLGLVQSLLDLKALESPMTPELTELHLNQLISKKKKEWAQLSDRKGIQLKLNIPDTMPAVKANPKWLGDVLNNLISNAVKFMQPKQL